MTLLDGKKTSADIKESIRLEVEQIKKDGGKIPHLAAILVGEDGASQTYVNRKVKDCEYVGFESTLLRFQDSITEEELLAEIEKVNQDADIDGLIVQLPLPKHISKDKVMATIDPKKDVDGFHIDNVGRMVSGKPCYLPATPYGILLLLEKYGIETRGKHCVVVGRSHIVGTPMSILMNLRADCTVTITHRHTVDLPKYTKEADILIVAVGIPEFIKADMVKDDVVVVDVGITRVEDTSKKSGFSLKGDVAFDEVAPKSSFITPVPGGVGPMTIASLLKNTLLAAKGEIY